MRRREFRFLTSFTLARSMTRMLPSFPAHDREIALTTKTWGELLAEIETRLASGSGFAIATMNLDHIVKLKKDPAFQAAYLAHDLRVADGNPVVWLSRLSGRPVELIPGADLVRSIAGLAAAKKAPIALVGATDASLARAAKRLCAEIPGLEIACRIAPPMHFDPDGDAARKLIDRVCADGARIVFTALGAPKQERMAALGVAAGPNLGFVSVGAGLDFIAGTQMRAPAWVRRIAMEWLWRFLSEPNRLAKRYFQCALALPRLTLHALRQRRAGGAAK